MQGSGCQRRLRIQGLADYGCADRGEAGRGGGSRGGGGGVCGVGVVTVMAHADGDELTWSTLWSCWW